MSYILKPSFKHYQADDCDILVSPVLHVILPGSATQIPVCTVNERPLEILQALNFGPRPAAEDAHSHEEEVCYVVKLFKFTFHIQGWPFDSDMPFTSFLLVACMDQFMAELDVGFELVFLDYGV